MTGIRNRISEGRHQSLYSYWFRRFQVFDTEQDSYACRDWLHRGVRLVLKRDLAGLGQFERAVTFFCRGFVRPSETSFPAPVRSRAKSAADLLFWQFPCRTEGAAFDVHQALLEPGSSASELHCYVGLPWATWIDKQRVDHQQFEAKRQVQLLSIRLSGVRQMLSSIGMKLRVHTVCQHIDWMRMLDHWRRIGITDLWLSHSAGDGSQPTLTGMQIHPWHLYAVNVEDPERRHGLQIGKDPSTKKVLASFIGTHMPHYLSDVRLRLRVLAGHAGFDVQVTQEKWHFEEVVYRHQVHHEPLATSYVVDEAVSRYNNLLSDSVFSLCPAGAGPNTLRLWESLAAGSIPVLLGPNPQLPVGGTLPTIDWDGIVLRVPDEQIPELPSLLAQVTLDEVRVRQHRGMQAYQAVRAQRCF